MHAWILLVDAILTFSFFFSSLYNRLAWTILILLRTIPPCSYLAHIGKYYDLLTDGIFFMQADPRHAPSQSLQKVKTNICIFLSFFLSAFTTTNGITCLQIVNWAHVAGIAPVAFYPLGSKQSAGGDPKTCLRNWQSLLFQGEASTGDTRRTGHYRNGIFCECP